jgi:hypothetical protein
VGLCLPLGQFFPNVYRKSKTKLTLPNAFKIPICVPTRICSYQDIGNVVRKESLGVEHVGQHLGRRVGGDLLVVGVLVHLQKSRFQ